MQASVTWQGRMSFTGTADSGFTVPLGTTPAVGGDNDGFRPLELMAISLAGCTAMDVISILHKKREEVTAFEVRVQTEQANEHPRNFTRMQIEYIFTGRNLNPKAVERAIELSEQKYCPAQSMLRKAVTLEHSYIIHEAE